VKSDQSSEAKQPYLPKLSEDFNCKQCKDQIRGIAFAKSGFPKPGVWKYIEGFGE
jgi:hypothetical protein